MYFWCVKKYNFLSCAGSFFVEIKNLIFYTLNTTEQRREIMIEKAKLMDEKAIARAIKNKSWNNRKK